MKRLASLRLLRAMIATAMIVCIASVTLSQPPDGQDDLPGDLVVLSWDTWNVLRYDATTGDFIDEMVPKLDGGMNKPYGVVFGPDGNLYVTAGQFAGPGQIQAVLRYDGSTGAFIDEFAGEGELVDPRGLIFGPDGDLYVADNSGGSPGGRVLRFDGQTGEYQGDFVSPGVDRPRPVIEL